MTGEPGKSQARSMLARADESLNAVVNGKINHENQSRLSLAHAPAIL